MVAGRDHTQHERGAQSGVGGFARLAGNSGQKLFAKLSFNVVELIGQFKLYGWNAPTPY
jgi:hypothetical protein